MKRSTRFAALMSGVVLMIVAATAALFVGRNHRQAAWEAKAQELFELRNVGIARLENHRNAEAAEAFTRLTELAPDEPLGWQNLAIAKAVHWKDIGTDQQQAYATARKEAFEALDQFKAHVGDTDVASFLQGQLLLYDGDEPGAVSAFEGAAIQASDNAAFWYSLYSVKRLQLQRQRDPDEALRRDASKALQTAYELSENNLRASLDFALAQTEARSPDAVEVLKRLAEQVTPLAEGLKELKGVDLMPLLNEAQANAEAGKWPAALTRVRGIANVLTPEEAVKSDQKRLDPNILDFVRFEFSDERLQALGREHPSLAPLAARLSETPAQRLDELRGVRDFQLADFDLDSRLDLVVLHEAGVSVLTRDENGAWQIAAEADAPADARRLAVFDLDVDFNENQRLAPAPPAGPSPTDPPRGDSIDGAEKDMHASWCVSADVEVVVYGVSGLKVFENRLAEQGTSRSLVERETQPELTGLQGISNLLPIDVDGEGDLDLAILSQRGLSIWSNRGDFTFRDLTSHVASMPKDWQPATIAVVDWDHDIDLDLLLAGGSTLGWVENLRHGGLRWRSFDTVSLSLREAVAVEALDADGNGSWDVAIAAQSGVTLAPTRSIVPTNPVWLTPQSASAEPAREVQSLDFDSDGIEDLLTWREASLRLLRGRGDGSFMETDAFDWSGNRPAAVSACEAGDLDGDGDLDLLLADGGALRVLTNNVSAQHKGIVVWLKAQQVIGQDAKASGRVNAHGIGSLLELRTGPIYQKKLVQRQWTHFGVGSRRGADALRVIWTNGIPENVIQPTAGQKLCEVQELLGSCPYAYGWNGARYEFITDLCWAAPIGLQFAEGVLAPSREWEFVKLPGESLAPLNGELHLQITEELWEAAYFDQVKLIAVDHPGEIAVFTNEKVGPAEIAEHRIHTVRKPQLPKAARDMHGRDVLPIISKADDKFAKLFEAEYRQGFVEPHYLELDLGDLAGAQTITLFLTGWIRPTDTGINVSVSQNPRIEAPKPPALWTPDASGQWREVRPFMGFPGGKTKTIAVDVSDVFTPGDWRLRIVTTNEIYWDAAFFTVDEPEEEVRVAELPLLGADLHWRGFSARVPRPNHGPDDYDYEQVSRQMRWPPLAGRYTAYGDVTELLGATDARLVVFGAGDEMTLRFLAPPAPPEGWQRDYVLNNVGWDKDANLSTVTGTSVEPLPYVGMRSYPPSIDDSPPADAAYLKYLQKYQTREQPPGLFWKRLLSGDLAERANAK